MTDNPVCFIATSKLQISFATCSRSERIKIRDAQKVDIIFVQLANAGQSKLKALPNFVLYLIL